jgi:hypothetical protein
MQGAQMRNSSRQRMASAMPMSSSAKSFKKSMAMPMMFSAELSSPEIKKGSLLKCDTPEWEEPIYSMCCV